MNLRPLAHLGGYTALAVVLTAGAAQSLAGSNTVYGDDIVNGTVKSADIGDGTVTGTDIKNGTLTGADVADNSLKGADIDESTLTKVPAATQADDATTLATHPVNDFLQSSANPSAVVVKSCNACDLTLGPGSHGAGSVAHPAVGVVVVTFAGAAALNDCSAVTTAVSDGAPASLITTVEKAQNTLTIHVWGAGGATDAFQELDAQVQC